MAETGGDMARFATAARLAAWAGLALGDAFGPSWTAAGAFVVGRGLFNGPTDWFAGNIDQVRVWNRALSDTDVSALV